MIMDFHGKSPAFELVSLVVSGWIYHEAMNNHQIIVGFHPRKKPALAIMKHQVATIL